MHAADLSSPQDIGIGIAIGIAIAIGNRHFNLTSIKPNPDSDTDVCGCGYFRLNMTVTMVCAATGSPFKSVGLYCHCFTASIAASTRIGWPDSTSIS